MSERLKDALDGVEMNVLRNLYDLALMGAGSLLIGYQTNWMVGLGVFLVAHGVRSPSGNQIFE